MTTTPTLRADGEVQPRKIPSPLWKKALIIVLAILVAALLAGWIGTSLP
jgi:hypothetical protein